MGAVGQRGGVGRLVGGGGHGNHARCQPWCVQPLQASEPTRGLHLDLLGGSSWVWRTKHNKLHHANTNVVGIDTDIDQAPFARMAPQQPWRPWHRYQHPYMSPMYGAMALRMVFFADFAAIARNQLGADSSTGGHSSRALIAVAAGKVAHLTWAVAIPLAFHPWSKGLIVYGVCSWCLGRMLAVTFQLAHCVSETTFVAPDAEYRGRRFTVHQLATTDNVHCGVPMARHAVRFFMGGLDAWSMAQAVGNAGGFVDGLAAIAQGPARGATTAVLRPRS